MQAVSEHFWTARASIWGADVSGITLSTATELATDVKTTGIVATEGDYQPKHNPRQFKRFYEIYVDPNAIIKQGYYLTYPNDDREFVIHEVESYPEINPIYHRIFAAVLD